MTDFFYGFVSDDLSVFFDYFNFSTVDRGEGAHDKIIHEVTLVCKETFSILMHNLVCVFKFG